MNDSDGLKRLWIQCFADEPDYVDLFFARGLVNGRIVCAEVSGKLAGAVYLLPAHVRYGAKAYPALYGYAVGVDPEYRRRGICETMFREIYAAVRKEGCGFFLHPASAQLVSYYERIGMSGDCFAVTQTYVPKITAAEADTALKSGDPVQYSHIRRQYTQHEGALLWPDSHLCYAWEEALASGGFCQMTADGACLALGRREQDTLILKELYAPREKTESFLQLLAKAHGASRIHFQAECSRT
jgi:GNAT superfamily N-acetyltransferase